MGIKQQEVHEQIIQADFTQDELDQIIIEYVLRKSNIDVEPSYKAVNLHYNEYQNKYSAQCKIKVDLKTALAEGK